MFARTADRYRAGRGALVISRYRLLAERLRTELATLEQVVERTEDALSRATQQPQHQDFFLAAAALDLHGFYVGLERLFELIAGEVDKSLPTGPRWHRDLVAQMCLAVPKVRPQVLSPETCSTLRDYLEFRHVVRNVYTFNLQPDRINWLVGGLRRALNLVRRDLLAFAEFLTELSTADEEDTQNRTA
jgi:hypothetical protein